VLSVISSLAEEFTYYIVIIKYKALFILVK